MFDTLEAIKSIPPAHRLAAAHALVEHLLQADLTDLPDAAHTEQLVASTALLERVEALACLHAGAWEPRQIWHGTNARSSRAWLVHHSTLSTPAAGRILRTGRFVHAHPRIADELRTGQLTSAKAALLTAAVTPNRVDLFARDEEVLLATIAPLDADDTATVLRRWQALADDHLANDDAAAQRDRRGLRHSQVGNQWRTDGTFDLTDGATIEAALTDAMGPFDPADRPGGVRTSAQRRADALTAICRSWLGHRNHGHGANPVATVNLHMDARTATTTSAAGFDPDAFCDLVPGGAVPRATAQRLLCDSVVGRIVLGAEGEVLDFGRLKRLFTPAQRRAMIARDGPTCVIPYCPVPHDRCQAHHLDPFGPDHGHTDIARGGLVCDGHHFDIHERHYVLARSPDNTWTFTAPDGTTWTSRPHPTAPWTTITTETAPTASPPGAMPPTATPPTASPPTTRPPIEPTEESTAPVAREPSHTELVGASSDLSANWP